MHQHPYPHGRRCQASVELHLSGSFCVTLGLSQSNGAVFLRRPNQVNILEISTALPYALLANKPRLNTGR
jgi:hypothetical protein